MLAYLGVELQITIVFRYLFELNGLKLLATIATIVAGFMEEGVVEEIVFRGYLISNSRK
ncbi:MAG: hypothetical protein ACP5I6_07975 [Caldisphaera sp.]|nr:hypothetical protein [Caldisphaera sp.]